MVEIMGDLIGPQVGNSLQTVSDQCEQIVGMVLRNEFSSDSIPMIGGVLQCLFAWLAVFVFADEFSIATSH